MGMVEQAVIVAAIAGLVVVVVRAHRRAAAQAQREAAALARPCVRCGQPAREHVRWLDADHTEWACDLDALPDCSSAHLCYVCGHHGPEQRRDYTDRLMIEWAHHDCLARYPAKRRRGRQTSPANPS